MIFQSMAHHATTHQAASERYRPILNYHHEHAISFQTRSVHQYDARPNEGLEPIDAQNVSQNIPCAVPALKTVKFRPILPPWTRELVRDARLFQLVILTHSPPPHIIRKYRDDLVQRASRTSPDLILLRSGGIMYSLCCYACHPPEFYKSLINKGRHLFDA